MGLFDAFKKKKPEQIAEDIARLQQQFDAFSMEGKISVPQAYPQEQIEMPPVESLPEPEQLDAPPTLMEEEAVPEPAVQEEPVAEPAVAYEEDLPEPERMEKPSRSDKKKGPAKKGEKTAPKQEEDFDSRLAHLKEKVEEKVKHKHSEELEAEFAAIKSKLHRLETKMSEMPLRDISVRVSDLATEKNLINDKVLVIAKKVDDHHRILQESVPSKNQIDVIKENQATLKKQMEALTDSVDSLKNTIYMLNKKVDLTDQSKRTEQIESKIKEIIIYLNKITRIITK